MDDQEIGAVIAVLGHEHPAALYRSGNEGRLRLELQFALALLPDASHWYVARDRPAVRASSAGTLLQVSLDSAPARVVMTSRPIDGTRRMAVSLEWDEPTAGNVVLVRETKWTFHIDRAHEGKDDAWEHIAGGLRLDQFGPRVWQLNRAELFARSLAEAAGWTGALPPEASAADLALAS